jgi:cytochrome P450
MKPVGLPRSVFFCEQADIKAILTAPADVLHPGAGAAVIEPLVGERSFIIADEDEHLAGRRALMPAYQRKLVKDHERAIERIVAREMATWPSDIPFAVHPYLRSLTLRVILSTLFTEEDHRVSELHRHILAMLSVTDSLLVQEPQLRRVPGWHGMWKRFSAERAIVDGLIRDLLGDGAFAEHGVTSLLAQALNPDATTFTTQQLRDGVMSLVLAGHETTASQLAWAFQLIAHHPRALSELLSENDRDEDAYLTATIQEAMRHKPVFLCTIPRVLQRDYEIAGTVFRPPAHLLGCIHLMHHDPRLYDDPQSFVPERFLGRPPKPPGWLPWGGGRKRCPGSHLALLEMCAVLRAALARWEILPVARAIEPARWRSVIVTPGRGSRVLLRTRRHGCRPPAGPGGGAAGSIGGQPRPLGGPQPRLLVSKS